MTFTIARKEALETFRDGRFWWASAVILVLLLGAVWSGYDYTRRVGDQQAEAAAAERAVWVGQEEKNPHSAAHFGSYAFKPVTPLLAVDRGVTAYTGVALFMEGHAVQDARYRPAVAPPPLAALALGQTDLYPASHKIVGVSAKGIGSSDALVSPLRLVAGSFDLAFVLLYLLPPTALAHGAYLDLARSGDRQQNRTLEDIAGYQQAFQAFFEPLIFANQPLTAEDYDRVPAFAAAPPAARESVRWALPAVLKLVVLVGVMLGLVVVVRKSAALP